MLFFLGKTESAYLTFLYKDGIEISLTEITYQFKATMVCRRENRGIGIILTSRPKRLEIKPKRGRIFIKDRNNKCVISFFSFCLILLKAFNIGFSTCVFLPFCINLFINLANQKELLSGSALTFILLKFRYRLFFLGIINIYIFYNDDPALYIFFSPQI
jgi:hypothetical protein